MITLYTFGAAFGLPDPSPFVMKAEMLLKLAGLPYRVDTTGFRRAPKGKLPYIDDEGVIVADSSFIRWHIEKKYSVDLDRSLSSEQKGIAWAAEKLLEDNLYWAIVDARWNNDKNFAKGPAHFFRAIPWPMRPIIQVSVRRQLCKALKAHGLGRHTEKEKLAIATKGIGSIAAILGDKPYFMGSQPCGADATVFAFVASFLCSHFETPMRTAVEIHPNLMTYSRRMMQQYFPDFALNG